MDELLTPKEVAALLKVSEQTIKELLRKEVIRGVKVGRQWRIAESDLQKYVDQWKAGK